MCFAWAYIEDPWKEFDEDHLPYLSHQCARSMAVRLNSAYQGRAETTHFFRRRFESFWVLSILKRPAIVVSTVCPYPVAHATQPSPKKMWVCVKLWYPQIWWFIIVLPYSNMLYISGSIPHCQTHHVETCWTWLLIMVIYRILLCPILSKLCFV